MLTKQPKTAIVENRRIMHGKLSKCTSCMPIDCVSIDTLLIQVAKLATLITNIFGIGAMNAADIESI